jgi:membrane-associated protease RseP (regulator of RpoE activity)
MVEEALPRPRAKPRLPAVNVALFVLTLASTLWAGFTLSPLAANGASPANVIHGGLPFAASLVAILLCHEMGHYALARRHHVDTTLPYFIPAPFGIGTFGAVIRLRSLLPTRRAALDIGAAGPLAGFAVALPVLLWGVAHSAIVAIPPGATAQVFGSPLAIARSLAVRLATGAWPAGGDGTAFGDSIVTRLAIRAVLGPMPAGHDVALHPVALAAWFGLLLTALNVVPVGQLDGGHVAYALLGRWGAERVSRATAAALLACGLFLSWNWFLWWALTRFVVGVRHPPTLLEEPLDPRRRAVALATLLLLPLTFVPVPVSF